MIIDLSFVDILKADGTPPEEILETLVRAVSVANEKQRQQERNQKRRYRARVQPDKKCPGGHVQPDKQNQALSFGTKLAILPSPIVSKKERKNNILLIVPGDMSDFDTFWKAYPRKEGKRNAMKSYQKAIKLVGADKLLSSLRSQISRPGFDPKFFPHAATWLNGHRWEDEIVLLVTQRPGFGSIL